MSGPQSVRDQIIDELVLRGVIIHAATKPSEDNPQHLTLCPAVMRLIRTGINRI